jgi:hypothetical protein
MLRAGSMVVDVSPPPNASNRAEELIAALDRYRVGDSAGGNRVYVLGVHTDGRDLWIQVALREDGRDNLVLHLPPEATAQDAVATLQATPLGTSAEQRVIQVPHRT